MTPASNPNRELIGMHSLKNSSESCYQPGPYVITELRFLNLVNGTNRGTCLVYSE